MFNIKIILFTSLILLTLLSCAPQPQPVLKVGTNQWPGYEILYLAKELGYFDDNIKLIEQTSASDVISALKHGQIDVAALTLDEVLILAQTETDLRVFLVMDISDGGDMVLAKSGITQLSELKGKCIAVENGALGAFMLSSMLDAAKLQVSDVEIRSVAVDQHFKYISENNCDAVVTFQPAATQIAKLGFVDLFNSKQIPNKIVDVLVTRQEVFENQNDHLSSLVSSQFKALHYLKQNPAQAYNFLTSRLALSEQEVSLVYQGLKLPDRQQNKILLDQNNPQSLQQTLDHLTDFLLLNKLLHKKPEIQMLLSERLLNE